MSAIPKDAAPRQDKRALWNESKELRDSVREVLREWGDAVRGGWPPLGYPKKATFIPGVTPERSYNVERVQAVTDSIMLWNMIQREEPDYERRANILRLLLVLRLNYIVPEIPQELKARKMNVSRATFQRLLEEANFRFWVLHW